MEALFSMVIDPIYTLDFGEMVRIQDIQPVVLPWCHPGVFQ